MATGSIAAASAQWVEPHVFFLDGHGHRRCGRSMQEMVECEVERLALADSWMTNVYVSLRRRLVADDERWRREGYSEKALNRYIPQDLMRPQQMDAMQEAFIQYRGGVAALDPWGFNYGTSARLAGYPALVRLTIAHTQELLRLCDLEPRSAPAVVDLDKMDWCD